MSEMFTNKTFNNIIINQSSSNKPAGGGGVISCCVTKDFEPVLRVLYHRLFPTEKGTLELDFPPENGYTCYTFLDLRNFCSLNFCKSCKRLERATSSGKRRFITYTEILY